MQAEISVGLAQAAARLVVAQREEHSNPRRARPFTGFSFAASLSRNASSVVLLHTIPVLCAKSVSALN
jgi:hypothetical protein